MRNCRRDSSSVSEKRRHPPKRPPSPISCTANRSPLCVSGLQPDQKSVSGRTGRCGPPDPAEFPCHFRVQLLRTVQKLMRMAASIRFLPSQAQIEKALIGIVSLVFSAFRTPTGKPSSSRAGGRKHSDIVHPRRTHQAFGAALLGGAVARLRPLASSHRIDSADRSSTFRSAAVATT